MATIERILWKEGDVMAPIVCSAPTLAVAAIYCIWRAWAEMQFRHQRLLRERVTYMLWVMANGIS